MEYDKTRYLELLKESQNLEKKGLSLYKEDQDKYMELLGYKVRLEEQKNWESRKKIFSIMNNFINGKLTGEDFDDEFMVLWEEGRDEPFIDYEPDPASKDFSIWVNRIFISCELFEPEAEENEEYNEKWLKGRIIPLFIQMEKEYNSN